MPPRRSVRGGTSKKAAAAAPASTVFAGATIMLAGTDFTKTKAALSKSIKDCGGTPVTRMNKSVTHFIGSPSEAGSARATKAAGDGLPVLAEGYIDACIAAATLLPPPKFPLTAAAPAAASAATTTSTTTAKTSKVGSKRKAAAAPAPTAPAAKKADTALTKVVFKKTGKAPVDRKCPYQSNAHVLEQGGVVYDAMLNQTDIRNNNNKFYVIQVVVRNGTPHLWTRWGRVGLDGQNAWAPFGSTAGAISAFKAKFNQKTSNSWDTWVGNNSAFQKVPGKYNPILMDYGDDDEDELEDAIKSKLAKKNAASSSSKTATKAPECKLDARIQDFVNMITDTQAMQQTLVEMNLDVKKMPLGKLSKTQINAGYTVLKNVEAALKAGSSNRLELEDLSNRFYTLIPHVFGMSVPPIINSVQLLKQKMDMLEAMGDIEIATSLLKGGSGDVHPIDANYAKLNTELEPVEKGTDEWKMVCDYTKNTHGHTHRAYTLEPVNIFRVNRAGEDARYAPFANDHNRRLLWHGSRTTNFMGILSQGLRIAPPEAPATGYMFGKGVYFADMVTKSANYCRVDRNTKDQCGVMLLSEVALGDMYKRKHAEFVTKLPGKDLSCFGMGRTAPDPAGDVIQPNGCMVPMGKGGPSGVAGTSLEYNEFIVYDVNQIKIKYLIKMKFKSKFGY